MLNLISRHIGDIVMSALLVVFLVAVWQTGRQIRGIGYRLGLRIAAGINSHLGQPRD